jgi:hypothetical protein
VDETTVFTKTLLGGQVARDGTIPMPRSMRTLLITVDGRTTLGTFQRMLTHLGDLSLLFEALEVAGYVEQVQTFREPRRAAPSAQTRSASSSGLARQNGVDDRHSPPSMFPPTAFPSAGSSSQSQNTSLLERIDNAWPSTLMNAQSSQGLATRMRGPSTNMVMGTMSSAIQTANLNAAKSLMTDFLLKHMPDVAMEVSLQLDRVESISALESSLKDYTHLVSQLGSTGVQHINSVRKLIQK